MVLENHPTFKNLFGGIERTAAVGEEENHMCVKVSAARNKLKPFAIFIKMKKDEKTRRGTMQETSMRNYPEEGEKRRRKI